MKTVRLTVVLLLVLSLGVTQAWAQATSQGQGESRAQSEAPSQGEQGQQAGQEVVVPPEQVYSDTAEAQATVQSVDKAARTLTLARQDGGSMKVKVGEDVQAFDQIEAGDTINVEYYESVAVGLLRPTEAAPDVESVTVYGEPEGGEPGAVVADVVTVTATVEDVNKEERTVTLGLPEGLAVVKVDESVENFDKVQKGDEVVVMHTEALATDLEKQEGQGQKEMGAQGQQEQDGQSGGGQDQQ